MIVSFLIIFLFPPANFFFLIGYSIQAFITQDSDDRDFLFKNLRSYDVPVINHVGDEGQHRNPFQTTEEVLL